MWKFIKYVFATLIGTVLGVIILVLIGVGILTAVASSVMSDDVKPVEQNSILILKLEEPIEERVSENPFKNFDFGSMKSAEKLGLHDIVHAISAAQTDDNIKGIFLQTSSLKAGISTVDEIRNALIRFKESGKFIISHSEYYTQSAYYLASVANRIYLKQEGLVEFKGISAQVLFFKDALEKIGITPQVIRHGKFKSAVEPFVSDKMSAENRAQLQRYIDNVWQHIINGISAERRISVIDLNNIADNLSMNNASKTVEYGFVDELKYYDEVLAELRDSIKIDQSKDIPAIYIADYIRTVKANDAINNVTEKPEIAVIIASGNIVSGEGEEDNIGGERIARAIREARTNDKVNAIILRVNSGGGSALASESVWRESLLASQQKSFVVSMGDLAASGGYYIACPADYIVANPTTITGSIGVFGIIPQAKELMNKIGVATETVSSNKYSDLGTMTRSLYDKEKQVIADGIDDVYKTFISHVADGRKMSLDMVDSIGQGRIWTGTDAYKLGLVDMLGDMQTAMKVAADMANIQDYKIDYLPKSEDPFDQLFNMFSAEEDAHIKEIMGNDVYSYYMAFKKASDVKGIQTRIPMDMIIE